MAQNNAVVAAIMAVTSNAQVQAAMLLGSHMESGWNASSVGDQGTSFGPFQIHLPAHPGVTSSQAENPTWAAQYMLPTYEAAVNKVPAALWGSNPSQAAATAAFYAERPAKMYSSSQISSGWPAVEAALGGNSSALATSGAGSSTNATDASSSSSSTGILSGVEDDLSTVLNYSYMGAILVGAGLLLTVGLFVLFKDEILQTAGKTAGAVGTVASFVPGGQGVAVAARAVQSGTRGKAPTNRRSQSNGNGTRKTDTNSAPDSGAGKPEKSSESPTAQTTRELRRETIVGKTVLS